jgi:hypothetical protein
MPINKTAGLLQREVAELLNISRPRVAQLVAAGHLGRNAAGKIDREEVERCKQEEPINWTHPAARGGRPSQQKLAEQRNATLWQLVAGAMNREGWGDLRNDEWRHLYKALSVAMKHYGLRVEQ